MSGDMLQIMRWQGQITDILKKLDKDKRVVMNELKKNFNNIEGASFTGADAWRFERNLNRKILRPAKAVTSCQLILSDLMKSNMQFGSYLDHYKRLRGIIKPKNQEVVEPVGLYGYDKKKTRLDSERSPGKKSLRVNDSPSAKLRYDSRSRTQGTVKTLYKNISSQPLNNRTYDGQDYAVKPPITVEDFNDRELFVQDTITPRIVPNVAHFPMRNSIVENHPPANTQRGEAEMASRAPHRQHQHRRRNIK
jgi:hypothetical protein